MSFGGQNAMLRTRTKTAIRPDIAWVKRLLCATAFLLGAGPLAAKEIPLPRTRAAPHLSEPVPLPPPRPSELPRPDAVPSGESAKPSTPETEAPVISACRQRLTSELAIYRPLPPISGPGECGADDVLELQAVVLPDKTRASVKPPATLRCTMAEALVHWVREDVVPVVSGLGPLREIDNFDSFECRGRNRVAGAKVSEHGHANAIDVRSFKLGGGASLILTDAAAAKDLRTELRRSGCARFTTVLGPGSDSYHENHIHLDLIQRRNGYRICQWDIREPESAKPEVAEAASTVPLPRPRPLISLQTSRGAVGGKL